MPFGEPAPAAAASKFQRLQVRPSRIAAAEAARGGCRAAPARSAYVWSLSGCASWKRCARTWLLSPDAAHDRRLSGR